MFDKIDSDVTVGLLSTTKYTTQTYVCRLARNSHIFYEQPVY